MIVEFSTLLPVNEKKKIKCFFIHWEMKMWKKKLTEEASRLGLPLKIISFNLSLSFYSFCFFFKGTWLLWTIKNALSKQGKTQNNMNKIEHNKMKELNLY